MMKITAIVLAGGKSLRLGRNKAVETVLGKSLIQHVVDRLRPLANQILIVTSQNGSDLPHLPGTEKLVDVFPAKGPLAGIYTGLTAAKNPYSIAVACDMPFLNVGLLKYMVDVSAGFDTVVPRLSEGKVEPLQAVYGKGCLERMRLHLESGQLEVYALFPFLRVRYIEIQECRRFDPELLSFTNINNQSDLDRAIALASITKV